MLSTGDAELLQHRQVFSFYYEKADLNETLAMDALYFVRRSLMSAVNHPKATGLPELADVLSKMTDVLELQFMDLVRVVYTHPAYRALDVGQRRAVDEGCLRIEFTDSGE